MTNRIQRDVSGEEWLVNINCTKKTVSTKDTDHLKFNTHGKSTFIFYLSSILEWQMEWKRFSFDSKKKDVKAPLIWTCEVFQTINFCSCAADDLAKGFKPRQTSCCIANVFWLNENSSSSGFSEKLTLYWQYSQHSKILYVWRASTLLRLPDLNSHWSISTYYYSVLFFMVFIFLVIL